MASRVIFICSSCCPAGFRRLLRGQRTCAAEDFVRLVPVSNARWLPGITCPALSALDGRAACRLDAARLQRAMMPLRRWPP